LKEIGAEYEATHGEVDHVNDSCRVCRRRAVRVKAALRTGVHPEDIARLPGYTWRDVKDIVASSKVPIPIGLIRGLFQSSGPLKATGITGKIIEAVRRAVERRRLNRRRPAARVTKTRQQATGWISFFVLLGAAVCLACRGRSLLPAPAVPGATTPSPVGPSGTNADVETGKVLLNLAIRQSALL